MKKSNLLVLLLLVIIGMSSCKKDEEETIVVEKKVALITNPNLLTVINIMTPNTSDKINVLTLLKEGIDETMSKQQGYISSNVHSSMDNEYIINYSQWETGEDLQSAGELVGSGGAPKMAQAFSLSSPDYHPFQVTAQYKSDNNKKVYIDYKNEILTIVNVLKPIDGVSQTELTQLLKTALADELVTQAGFISSTVHESMDNDYVVNYSQWTNQAALNTMVERLQSGNAPKLGLAFSNATPGFHPFTIVSSHFSN